MVKKVAKSTTSTVKKTVKKAASTVQKTLTKENKFQKLSNGHVKENPETKSDEEMVETTTKSIENIKDDAESGRYNVMFVTFNIVCTLSIFLEIFISLNYYVTYFKLFFLYRGNIFLLSPVLCY